MSVINRKEWASNQKAFKYEFGLEILKFTCELPLPCSLRFSFKRNSKGIETKNAFEGKPGLNEMTINQKLSSLSTILYNTDTKTFLSKQAQIVVNMYFNGSPKKLASCQIDMRSILDPKDIKASRSQTFDTVLTRFINQNSRECKLTYRLSCVFKEQIMPSEKSIGGPLNTSGFSMQQDKYFQKKYQVPSKDNHSVNSYTGNRYPSASKREKDDSSVRKFDYGYLTGLKSNITNQVSKQYDINSDMKSRDNKTEMNDGNYINRQLIDQQNKRSKAEAELTRNKVEITELKKKINQLSIQNMKIKEEMKISTGNKDAASQQEINSLQFKVYELNNQMRELKNQLQTKKRQGERWENQLSRLKSQKSQYEKDIMEKQKKIDELQRNQVNNRIAQTLQNQNSDLKYQIQNLRRYIEDLKKQYADQQAKLRTEKFKESQEMSSQIDYLRRENEKIRSNTDISQEQAKKINEYEQRLKQRTNEVYIKNRNLQEIGREIEEYKTRLNQYESQKSFMQREIIRLQQQSSDKNQIDKGKKEIEAKVEWLTSENNRMNENLRYYQGQLDEAHQIIQRIKLEQGQSEGRSAKLLPQINELQKKVNEFQGENGALRAQKIQLLKQKGDLQRELESMREDMFKSTASTTTNPQVQRLFRESLQMQVDLKFANDQLTRLRGLEQAFDNEKWRAQKEFNDRVQLEKQFQRIQKQLMNKNRTLMIQIQKSKMLNQQIGEQLSTINFYKEELQKNRGIIYNMEEQLNDLSMLNSNQKQQFQRLQNQNASLKNESQKWSGLQEKVKQLESRNNQKAEALETLNRTFLMTKGEIKDLQERNQELHRQLVSRDKSQYDVQNRLREMEKQKTAWESDFSKLSQEKRTLQKRNQMIVQQMHVMKKRFEQEKGRSLSFTRNEEFNKVRNLESEVQKKEKTISKLNKQKLQLQEENVKINVQVMKLLSELQKLKATSSYSVTSSYKTIGGTTLK